MRQGRSTGAPTTKQLARFNNLHRVGCVACWLFAQKRRPCEIHHLTIGGRHGQKRRGHDFTIGLCDWHHRGVADHTLPGLMRDAYGASYALEPKAFRDEIGEDEHLLEAQGLMIALLLPEGL